MRRYDKALPQDVADRLLLQGEYGILSTVDGKGQPYGVPLNYCFADNGIYVHCALEGHKLDNLRDNDKISFCVVGATRLVPDKFSTDYTSVIVTGVARRVQGAEKRRALVGLVEKYSADFIKEGQTYIEKLDHQTAVLRLDVLAMTGKSNREE